MAQIYIYMWVPKGIERTWQNDAQFSNTCVHSSFFSGFNDCIALSVYWSFGSSQKLLDWGVLENPCFGLLCFWHVCVEHLPPLPRWTTRKHCSGEEHFDFVWAQEPLPAPAKRRRRSRRRHDTPMNSGANLEVRLVLASRYLVVLLCLTNGIWWQNNVLILSYSSGEDEMRNRL